MKKESLNVRVSFNHNKVVEGVQTLELKIHVLHSADQYLFFKAESINFIFLPKSKKFIKIYKC